MSIGSGFKFEILVRGVRPRGSSKAKSPRRHLRMAELSLDLCTQPQPTLQATQIHPWAGTASRSTSEPGTGSQRRGP